MGAGHQQQRGHTGQVNFVKMAHERSDVHCYLELPVLLKILARC